MNEFTKAELKFIAIALERFAVKEPCKKCGLIQLKDIFEAMKSAGIKEVCGE